MGNKYFVVDKEPLNEIFGLSKKEKERKRTLEDLEYSYDNKFNAFCLSVSSRPVNQIENLQRKKEKELEDAIQEKKNAETKEDRLKVQVKIDYLKNVINKCKSIIKKKS